MNGSASKKKKYYYFNYIIIYLWNEKGLFKNLFKYKIKHFEMLSNISLPIIPCMIVYVTNNKEPWTIYSKKIKHYNHAHFIFTWKQNIIIHIFYYSMH